MSYRDKNSYDDMGRVGGSRRQGNERMDKKSLRIIVTVVIVGVLLCVGVIALWLMYFSSTEQPATVASNPMVVEPVQVPKGPATQGEPEGSTPVSTDSNSAGAVAATNLTRTGTTGIETPTPARTATPTAASRSVWYVEHTVQESETLDSLSETYGVSKETILSVNAIKNLSAIRPGVVLRIPDRNGQLYTVQSGDSLSIITNRFNPTLGWKTLQEINALRSEVIFPGQKLFIPSAEVDDDGSLAAYDRFVRPATGRITGLYGQTVVYGTSEAIVVLQGIWIEGPVGTEVTASGTGVVVDAGNVPDGMGRFVVLSHENGYKTTYAHLDQISVKVGDQVKQGGLVGTLGNSGTIGRNALYFSIEQEGTALNPANFF
ncbi:MAG: peptidase M23 [Spirochaetae bacterium HGW-Spirochaetae-2]|nr:MAG: peptidase M23 [Spirochaetae bacterium HGW-Spirochaetae-2]